MTWRDRYLPASFRGVPFVVQDVDQTGGRRVHLHEYPRPNAAAYRVRPLPEDLGPRARTFAVAGLVVGPDYDRTADELEDALEQPGRGELVHPHKGTVQVVALQYTRTEGIEDGGLARFEIEFVEVERLEITTSEDYGRKIEDTRAATRAAGLQAFADGIAHALVPEFVREATADATRAIGELLEDLDVFSGPAHQVAAFSESLRRLIDDAGALAVAPTTLAGAIFDAVDLVEDSAGNAIGSLEAYNVVLDAAPELGGGASALAATADANATLVYDGAKWAALAGAVAAAYSLEWPSLQDAIAARDALLERLDALLETAPDSIFLQLGDLRAWLVLAVPPEPESLPRVETIRLQVPTPALALASTLYDDPDRAAELVARNNPRHPARLPAGVDLEVLTSGAGAE